MTSSPVPLNIASVALVGLSLVLVPQTEAALVTASISPNQAIPDGQTAGINSSITIDAPSEQVQNVRVSLQIQGSGVGGAWNGDFYAALVHDTHRAVLLNRPGVTASNPVGYPDNGFNVTFDDAASHDVHLYRQSSTPTFSLPVTGTWQPDARDSLPSTVTSSTPRTLFLSEFQGLPVSGDWFLVLADTEFGGTGRLVSWSLEITTVTSPGGVIPEPATNALAIGVALLGLGWYRASRRGRPQVA